MIADGSRQSDERLKSEKSGNKRAKLSIVVNGDHIMPSKRVMTGLEIKKLAGRDGSFLLVLIDDTKSDDEGRPIPNEEEVQLKNGSQFRLINNPTFGSVVSLPPMLRMHLDELKRDGYDIVTKTDASNLGIIFKNYKVPGNIWTPQTIDLLVTAHDSYPNARMDMFWVSPPLSLKNGGQPEATSTTKRFNRTWQQFSWHTNAWDPAKDSIKTHLLVVKERLQRAR